MNDDFKRFPPPPDEADDPLLHALRQHLGDDFGQAPPARLWAGIRQQLPPAVCPWWRRPRRLLPLLALLLLSTITFWQVGQRYSAGPALPGQLATRHASPGLPPVGSAAPAGQAAVDEAPAAPLPQGTGRPEPEPAALAGPVAAAGTRHQPAGATASQHQAAASIPLLRAAAWPGRSVVLADLRKRAYRRSKRPTGASGIAGRNAAGYGPGATQPVDRAAGPAEATPQELAAATSTTRRQLRPRAGALAAQGAAPNGGRRGRKLLTTQEAYAANDQQRNGATGSPPTGRSQQPTPGPAGPTTPAEAASRQPIGLALLALRWPRTQGTLPGLPAPLPTPEAPPGPWLQPGRRWAVQVVAGPTVSYRSIREASTGGGLAYAAPTPTISTPSASADTSRRVGLERAAVGWGAQVQVQRLLTGRWALAAGLGYHEYATYLSLDVTTRTYSNSAGLSNAVVVSTTAVRQRDTYRVLTLPAQLRYALAPSRGRLALGVLGGLEPSLYIGGRTTEGSSCACEQREFTSATNSPYNSLSLALSLGLDVRYHLGGPASRWTLLAQPTGRYVASAFVRSPGWGYALRQPYSLGLLTGVAWEW